MESAQPIPPLIKDTPLGPIIPTEIPISSLPPHHTPPQKISKKKMMIIGGAIFFLLIVIVGNFFLIFQKPKPKKIAIKPTPVPTLAVSTVLPIERTSQQVLFPYVPHFQDLKISDIATFYDIRGIFNYKNNLIITSPFGIIEYNPKTNDIVRQNDTRLLSCVDSATLIGKKIYTACNTQATQHGISVIDLDSGKLEKRYSSGSANLSYVSLAEDKEFLWVGATNEIIRVDTTKDTMEEYTPQAIGIPACQEFSVFGYNGYIWTTCGNIPGIAIYSTETNTWTPFIPPNTTAQFYTLGYDKNTLYFRSNVSDSALYTYHNDTKGWDVTPATTVFIPSSKPEAEEIRAALKKNVIFSPLLQKGVAYLSYFDTAEKKVKDFELVLSDYIGISEIIDEKRYLFTRDAVDTLQKNAFPKSYKKLPTSVGLGSKTFVDPLANYAVLIASESASTPPFTAYLIELKKSTVTNLLTDPKILENLEDIKPEEMNMLAESLGQAKLFGTTKDADMTKALTGEKIFHIDFLKKNMIIFY